jgi:hypothetical protein
MTCSHRFTQLLGCFSALTTGLVDRRFRDGHIDHLTSHDLTSFESIHSATPDMNATDFETLIIVLVEKAPPDCSGGAFRLSYLA